RRRSYRALDGAGLGHVDEGHLELPRTEQIAEQSRRAEVRVVRRDNVRARLERLEHGRRRCGAGGEAGGECTTFELRQAFLERETIGIGVARVHETGAIAAVGLPLEGRR